MPTLFVFDPDTGAFQAETLPPEAQMPHVGRLRFSVADFMGACRSAAVWTDLRALRALDALAGWSAHPFSVDGGFRRIAEGAHPFGAPAHAGLSFDIGRALSASERAGLLCDALTCRCGFAVEAPYAAPRRVRLYLPCRHAFRPGDAGADVLALQDALLTAGLSPLALSGAYDAATRKAVRRLQQLCALPTADLFGTAEARALKELTSAYQHAKIMGRKRNLSVQYKEGAVWIT